ncbi:hypothetical protein PF005_g14170 [Phytophthora fragariae]|uniref:Uncharacterized protein n=1 Tax=Phytophthora fragariae TaxID=53985 RepID=A0A6A3T5P7_9STRA|nr:hypothetical protein PF003_g6140 [Phytophthora fragariae]KAE9130034.1 hypothetical protein PF007_g4646 [Phytophthora fragariae]KAE9203484.1 hypothetical protein PF005_g14170 [Phytophthora fragariae]KAE9244431.1 hypothetical protein PF002_g7764 [Phytophthora fragariae]
MRRHVLVPRLKLTEKLGKHFKELIDPGREREALRDRRRVRGNGLQRVGPRKGGEIKCLRCGLRRARHQVRAHDGELGVVRWAKGLDGAGDKAEATTESGASTSWPGVGSGAGAATSLVTIKVGWTTGRADRGLGAALPSRQAGYPSTLARLASATVDSSALSQPSRRQPSAQA